MNTSNITWNQRVKTAREALHVVGDLALNGAADRMRQQQGLPPASLAGRGRMFGRELGSAVDLSVRIRDLLEPIKLIDLQRDLVDLHFTDPSRAGQIVDHIVRAARMGECLDADTLAYRARAKFTLFDLAKVPGLLNGHEFERFTYVDDLLNEAVEEGDVLVFFPKLLIFNSSFEYEDLQHETAKWVKKWDLPQAQASMGSMTSLLALSMANTAFGGPCIIPENNIWLASTSKLVPLPLPGRLGGERFMKLTYLAGKDPGDPSGWWAGWGNQASSKSRYGASGATVVLHFRAMIL